jgi:phosphoribosylamine--glycine ligase
VLRTKEDALAAAAAASYPVVFKSDGLAAGKGVIICADEDEARAAIDEYFTEQRFGETDVIIEEFLEGVEVSLLAICDGERAYSLAPARDYKRIFDNDLGPNTGGMGAFSPVPEVLSRKIPEISADVHQPIIEEMKRRGAPFHGILYAGLMLTASGVKVLEYNTRFGDPETQALLPRLRSDLAELMFASTTPGGLAEETIEFSEERSVTLTHAGTAWAGSGEIVTAGGRVLNVTAVSDSVSRARDAAYSAAALIDFDGKQQRSDIAAGIDL